MSTPGHPVAGRLVSGRGTPERDWRAWGVPARFAPLDLDTPPARLLVVAPHPDDEVLGVGGLASVLAARGTRVDVVAVTDGGASHPGSPTLDGPALVARRLDERDRALRLLGLDATVDRLGVPDGEVAAAEDDVATRLTGVLARARAAGSIWCLATWERDGHPDHEAVGRAAARACAATGARLLRFPVWTWHWSVPDDPRVPWHLVRRIDLPDAVAAAKARAANAFETQVRPLSEHPLDGAVLPPHVLERLLRPAETVLLDEGLLNDGEAG